MSITIQKEQIAHNAPADQTNMTEKGKEGTEQWEEMNSKTSPTQRNEY